MNLNLTKIDPTDKPREFPGIYDANLLKIEDAFNTIETSIATDISDLSDSTSASISAVQTQIDNLDLEYATDSQLTELNNSLMDYITTEFVSISATTDGKFDMLTENIDSTTISISATVDDKLNVISNSISDNSSNIADLMLDFAQIENIYATNDDIVSVSGTLDDKINNIPVVPDYDGLAPNYNSAGTKGQQYFSQSTSTMYQCVASGISGVGRWVSWSVNISGF